MNLFSRYIGISAILLLFFGCSQNKKDKSNSDDILAGNASVLVDETILPIIEEQKEVFESSYSQAKITLVAKPEINAINSLIKGDAHIILLTRDLTEEENQSFAKRSITPRVYGVAYDAVVFVANAEADSTIKAQDITDLMQGNRVSDRKLVVDHPNSSLLRYMREYAKIEKMANTYITVKSTPDSILDEVATHKGSIGVLSYNQYLTFSRLYAKKDKIRILSVLNDTLSIPKYVKPTQASLSTGEYPLKREIKILNYQPNLGLGMGFSAFLTGDRGQRIVLKSGILPYTMPGREIIIKNSIN